MPSSFSPASHSPSEHAAQVAPQGPSSFPSSSSPPIRQRLRQWTSDITSLPASLAASPPLGRSSVCLLPPSSSAFSLHVGQAALLDERQRPAFLAHLRSHLDPLLADMPPMSRFGYGKKAVWSVFLSPSGRHFAHLSRELSHSGTFAISFGDSVVLVPTSPAPPALPPASTRIKLLNIPPNLAKEGLPQAILSAAGYLVRLPSIGAPIVPPPENEVLILQYRIGRDFNAAILLVDVLAPASDPHLHRLPPFLPAFSIPGFVFSTLVENDPLPRLTPSRNTAAPPSPSSPSCSPPPSDSQAHDASDPRPPPPPPSSGLGVIPETTTLEDPSSPDITMNGISIASWQAAAALRLRALEAAPCVNSAPPPPPPRVDVTPHSPSTHGSPAPAEVIEQPLPAPSPLPRTPSFPVALSTEVELSQPPPSTASASPPPYLPASQGSPSSEAVSTDISPTTLPPSVPPSGRAHLAQGNSLPSFLLSLQKDIRKFHAQALTCCHSDTLVLRNISDAVCAHLLSMASTLQQRDAPPTAATASRRSASRADLASSWRSTPPSTSPPPPCSPPHQPHLAAGKRRSPPVEAPPPKRDQRSQNLRSWARQGGFLPMIMTHPTPSPSNESPSAPAVDVPTPVRCSSRLTARRSRSVLTTPWYCAPLPSDPSISSTTPPPCSTPLQPTCCFPCAPMCSNAAAAAAYVPASASTAAIAATQPSQESMPPAPTQDPPPTASPGPLQRPHSSKRCRSADPGGDLV